MKLRVGAKGLISNADGKVLVVQEAADAYHEGTNPGKWDVVGGRIDEGEKLLDGLRREIKEESGLDVAIGSIIGATETFPTINGVAHHIIRVYYACSTDKTEVVLSEDHDQYQWIDPKDHASLDLMSDLHPVFDNYLKLV